MSLFEEDAFFLSTNRIISLYWSGGFDTASYHDWRQWVVDVAN